MPGDLIRVLMLGHPDPNFSASVRLENVPETWADTFEICSRDSDKGLLALLFGFRPQVIVSFGIAMKKKFMPVSGIWVWTVSFGATANVTGA